MWGTSASSDHIQLSSACLTQLHRSDSPEHRVSRPACQRPDRNHRGDELRAVSQPKGVANSIPELRANDPCIFPLISTFRVSSDFDGYDRSYMLDVIGRFHVAQTELPNPWSDIRASCGFPSRYMRLLAINQPKPLAN
nr:hypothetical protein Iba_chr15cCG5110 [Ipomoea batatas]